ncbi:MAG: D-alanyl-D-alanine carboxypeptidase family protein [Acidimicrobiales bacterium]
MVDRQIDERTVRGPSSRALAADLGDRQARARELRRARPRSRRRGVATFGTLGLVTVVVIARLLTAASSGTPRPSPRGERATAARASLPRIMASRGAKGSDSGAIPVMPFPVKGQGAVAFGGSGVVAVSKNEHAVPIASLTKMMTAYLVLRAHPLTGNEAGPVLHFTTADHRAWITYSERDLSNVELVNGEVLSEHQLLEALLIPSADNVADVLARWVGGTEARFVAMMNATAVSLGMTDTHYADASGVDPRSVSTAADQALLATVVMRNPVFASIVKLPDAPFPVEGHIWSYNPALGIDGIIGVKSGFTPAAAGCLVAAAWHTVAHRSVLVVAAVTGQPYGLWQAATADEALIKAAAAHIQIVSPFGADLIVASLTVPWSHRHVDLLIPAPVQLAGWGGLRFTSRLVGSAVTTNDLRHGWAAGSVVGGFVVRSQFGPVVELPLELSRAVKAPPRGSVVIRSPMSLGIGS